MKNIVRKWLAGVMSVVMVFSLLPGMARAEEDSGTPERTAVEQVQELIDALPDADTITADNRADVEAQLTAIDEAKLALGDDELDTLDITRYMAAVEAILALDNMAGANEPETMDTEVNVSDQSVSINQDGNYIITGNTNSNTITVTGGTVTITLRGVSITSSGNSPIDIQSGNVTLILESGTTNTFTSNNDNNAAIHVAENAYLTITGDGTLNATSKSKGAGIGGNYNSNAGHITIESGTITAKSNGDGAGIGGGHTDSSGKYGVFQSITISGGYVRGESGSNGAGIGNGCWGKTLGTITISGGIIHAKTAAKASSKPSSGDKAFDIGYSHSGSQSGGTISITGGVIFTENRGIKNPSYSNCLVVPKSGDITVYGNPTIKEDFTIPSGRTLTVPNGRTLTVAPGATLTVDSGATLTNNGTVQNNGRIVNNGTINGDISGNLPFGYKISVTAIVFDSVQEGYDQPEAKQITIKNMGTETVTISNVTVNGSDFTIIKGSENTVAVGDSNTSWTIQPRSGLAAGKHTATITVTYDGGRSATTTVSFQVDQAPIKYLNANGGEATCKVYTEVTGQTSTWNTGWYVVSGEQSISGWITVKGDVNLILTNDSVLTVKGNNSGDRGIVVDKGNSLTIYAQPPGTGSVGKISTSGSANVAGIGGSSNTAGSITIHGGQITASGGQYASAIGEGWASEKGGNIVITGGVVNAVKGYYVGTGTIADKDYDTFSTGTAGNAVIFAEKIGDHSNETKWSGIIFEGDTGKIYGTPTPIFSFEIPSNKTLNVEKDHPLHIAKGVTMTNKGTINIGTESDMNAVLNNEGTIINEGTIDVWGLLTHGEAGIKNQNGGKIVYHFNLDVKAPTFADAEYGYSQPPAAQEITITNNGEMDATITNVVITGEDFEHNQGTTGGTLTKEQTNNSWTIQPKANLPVGTHTTTITVTYSGGSVSNKTTTAEVTFTVIKATPVVTAPSPKTLAYTGEAQELVTGGTTTGGEMQYSLEQNGDYSTAIPKGTEAGSYTVWYKVVGDDNYNDVAAQSVTVTIGKGEADVTGSAVSITYGESVTLTVNVAVKASNGISLASAEPDTVVFTFPKGGTKTANVNKTSGENGTASVTIDANKVKDYFEPGTNEVTVSYGGSGNLNGNNSVKMTVTVNPKTLTFTFKAQDKTYNGDNAIEGAFDTFTDQLVSGDDVSVDTYAAYTDDANAGVGKTVTVTVTGLKGTDAEYYTLGEASSNTVTIDKAPILIDDVTPPTPNNRTYDGTSQPLVTAPAARDDGTMMYRLGSSFAFAGNFTEDIPTGSHAGTYSVQYYVKGDDNHNDSAQATVEVTISEKPVTLMWENFTDLVYTGTAKNVTASIPEGVIVDGDKEKVTVSVAGGDKVEANPGETYTATATLEGERASNYKLTNATQTYTIEKATPTVTVTASEKPTYGSEITLTAEVTAGAIDPANLAGTVTFTVGGTELGTGTADNAGNWTLTLTEANKDKQKALFDSKNVTAEYGGNGNIESGSGKQEVTVTPKALTYTVTAMNRVYNATTVVDVALTPDNLVGGDSVTLSATGNLDSADADTYTQVNLTGVTTQGDDAKYYSVESTADNKDLTGSVTISKATVTFDVSDNTHEYDGSLKKVTVTQTGPDGLTLAGSDYEVYYTAQGASGTTGGTKNGETDAGTYDVWVRLTGDTYKNYMFADDKQEAKVGELTISTVVATCVAPEANNLTYTREAQQLVTAGTPTGGTMMYALGDDGDSAPVDGEFKNTIPSETNAGTYYVWYYVKADGNHTDSAKACVPATIKKAPVSFAVSGNTFDYDTEAHKATVTQTADESPRLNPEDFSVTYGTDGAADKTANKTNVGTYDIYVTLSNDNFKFKDGADDTREKKLDEKLKITAVALELTVSGTQITYGQALSVSNLTGTAKIAGGKEIIGTWKWADDVASSYPSVKDNSEKTEYAVIFTPNPEYAGNFTADSLTTKITITVNKYQLTPKVVAESVNNKDYDGNTSVTDGELTFTDVSIFSRAPFNDTKPTISGTFAFTSKDAGTDTVNVTGIHFDKNGENYSLSTNEINNATVNGSIQQKEVALTWKLDDGATFEITYDGKVHTVTATATTNVGSETVNVTVDDGTQTDAGSYTATASGLTDGEGGEAKNYKLPTSADKGYTIKKATVSVVTITEELIYNTQPQNVGSVTVKTGDAPALTQGTDFKVVYTAKDAGDSADGTESKTDVGEYDIWVVLDSDNAKKNYEFAGAKDKAKVGTMNIVQAALTLTIDPVTITYGDELADTLLSGKATISDGTQITGTWAWGETDKGKNPAVSDSENTEYTVKFTPDTKYQGNFTDDSLSTEIKIKVNKATLVPSVDTVADIEQFSGETGTVGTIKLTGAVLGDSPTAVGTFNFDTPIAEENKSVTVTDIKLNDSWGENYELSVDHLNSVGTTAKIGKRVVTLEWKLDDGGDFEITYDGEVHTVTATVTNQVSDYDCTVIVTDGEKENAGTYIAMAALSDTNNYALPVDGTQQKEYTIKPAPVSFVIDEEVKTDWPTDETNEDPNPDGYDLGDGTKLRMIYDSYGHKVNVSQKAGEEVEIGAGTVNGFAVTYKRVKDSAGSSVTEAEVSEISDAGTYDIMVNLTPTEDDIHNYAFVGQGEDVYSLKIGEITIAPYTVHVTWSHLKYVYHAHKMHPNVRVQNAFKADVQPAVVPDNFDPAVGYSGKLLAFAETSDSKVGDYNVEVELYGTSAGNYVVDDNTETVTIVPAPVTFTVGDNIWVIDDSGALSRNTVTPRPAWGAVSTTPDVAVHHSYPSAGTAIDLATLEVTIEYWQNGEKIASPSEAGTYEVWVEIGNENYRHSATETGESHHVGELVITDDPDSIKTYTVTFDPGYEGAPDGPAKMEKVFPNQTVVMPAASGENENGTKYDITRQGYSFLGWSYNGRTYLPNEELHMPTEDVTLKGEWIEAVPVSGRVVQESSSGGASTPVSGATAVLKQGSEPTAEAVTGSDGTFDFGQVTPGIYNLEITYENGSGAKIVKTFLVEVGDSGSVDSEYPIPDTALNTVVEVAPGIKSAVSMDGMISGESADQVYTADDKSTVADGGTVEFKMSISEATLTGAQEEELPVSEEQISMVLDLELKKTVTSGGRSETENITDSKVPITTVIHLPAEIQGKSGYTVYRFHDVGGEEEMQTITTSRNANGEYLQVIRDGTAIELHAEFYSTYVLTWYQRSGGGVVAYPVTLPEDLEHGDVSVNYPNAAPGVNVTLTVTPDEGYELDELTITDRNGNIIPVTDNGDGTYSFTMPSSGVVVSTKFKLTVCDGGDGCPSRAFPDLDVTAWYHEYTDYVIETKLMQGSGGLFKPNGTLTRAEMVTVLWNMNGRGVVNYLMTYGDVSEEDWYAEAIRWATSEGVVDGYDNGNFGPNDKITREQMAKMLYNYEKKYGDGGFTGEWMFPLPFADTAKINDWAYEAVAWCYMDGVINGKDGNVFDPAGNALRCELAKVLTVYNQIDD